MKLCNIVLGAAAAASALAAPAADVPTPTAKTGKRSSKFKFVGANESGAEFGNKALPGQLGKDYTWPVRSSIDVCKDHRGCWVVYSTCK
jgi:endoglucanase